MNGKKAKRLRAAARKIAPATQAKVKWYKRVPGQKKTVGFEDRGTLSYTGYRRVFRHLKKMMKGR